VENSKTVFKNENIRKKEEEKKKEREAKLKRQYSRDKPELKKEPTVGFTSQIFPFSNTFGILKSMMSTIFLL